MSYEIKLDIFEGPLDLLLYLIRKNEIDIYNIPIALITEQYLEYLDMMRSLNLDLAGEYLVLAATLIHIKSRLLLPPVEGEDEEEEGEDPRAELVQQLLEYQAFKEAALSLDGPPPSRAGCLYAGCARGGAGRGGGGGRGDDRGRCL